MPSDLEFTGERFLPGVAGEIAHEHWHRYAFAMRFARGRRVLDVACGEGYGSALLAAVASGVVGIDAAADAIAHARATYAGRPGLAFEVGSAAALPLPEASADVVVSFETIEHLPAQDQPRMLAEIARVLAPDGVLVLSVPNPVEYSQAREYRNPFHLHEPSREELDALLAGAFPARRWYRQRRYLGSAIWSEDTAAQAFEALAGTDSAVEPAAPPAAMYFVVIAAKSQAAIGHADPALSLFSDRGEAELARLDAQAVEVLRLDRLLGERDIALRAATAHVHHLERLVAERERIVVERDAQLAAASTARAAADASRAAAEAERESARRDLVAAASARDEATTALASARQMVDALSAEAQRLERALEAQERIIAHRQSLRWWLALPWLRLKLWWQRTRRS